MAYSRKAQSSSLGMTLRFAPFWRIRDAALMGAFQICVTLKGFFLSELVTSETKERRSGTLGSGFPSSKTRFLQIWCKEEATWSIYWAGYPGPAAAVSQVRAQPGHRDIRQGWTNPVSEVPAFQGMLLRGSWEESGRGKERLLQLTSIQ